LDQGGRRSPQARPKALEVGNPSLLKKQPTKKFPLAPGRFIDRGRGKIHKRFAPDFEK